MTNAEELEFRDGARLVPDYLASMMGGFDTSQYTYQQAVQLANRAMLGQHLGQAQQGAINDHFAEAKVRDGHRR